MGVNAKEKFNDWMGMVQPDEEKQNPVDVNMKYETYCNAISDGGEEGWDFAWKRYTESTVASEKSTLLSSLGCTKEVWLLNRYLNMSLTAGSGVRKQDGSGVIGSVARNTVGRYLILPFCRFVFLSFCLFVFLSFCLFVFLSFCLFVFVFVFVFVFEKVVSYIIYMDILQHRVTMPLYINSFFSEVFSFRCLCLCICLCVCLCH